MEQRKNQFLIFSIILIVIGFLQYFRKIFEGYKMTKNGKILYIMTMLIFIGTTMFILYYTEVNNILSFLIGLVITTLSEHIAKLFLVVGDNFLPILTKLIQKFWKIDFSKELQDKNNNEKQEKK